MSGPFKVGDVCLAHGLVSHAEFNGCECVVLEPLAKSNSINFRTGVNRNDLRHLVEFGDGTRGQMRPGNLRRKQPPSSAKAIMRAAILKAKQPLGVPA